MPHHRKRGYHADPSMRGWPIAVWLAANAPAAEGELAVEPILYEGSVSDVWRAQFRDQLHDGLSGGRLKLTTAVASAKWAVRTTVSQRDGDFRVVVQAFRLGTSDIVAEAEDVCEMCGEGEVAERIQIVAAKLRTQIDSAVGTAPTLALRTRPPGALVELDGEPVGRTPIQLPVTEGPHHARFILDGYEVARLDVRSVAGLTVTREVELTAVQRRRRSRRAGHIAGIAMTGVGVASVITGAILLAFHAREVRSRCQPDADGDCKELFNTRIPGAVVLSVGGVIGLTGAGLWIHGARKRRRRGSR